MSDPIQPIDIALGELDDDRRAEAERLMRDDDFRRQVEELSPVVSALEDLPDEAWNPPAPPPLDLPATRESAAERRGILRLPRLSLPALAAAGACAVALLAIGFGIGVLASGDDDPSRGSTIALASLASVPEQASGSATVVDGDRLEVDVAGLPPSADGRYEMWLLNSPDDLVSLGSFRVGESGAATVEVPLPTTPDEFAFIDVSVEPDDGNPAHSGNSILRGPTA